MGSRYTFKYESSYEYNGFRTEALVFSSIGPCGKMTFPDIAVVLEPRNPNPCLLLLGKAMGFSGIAQIVEMTAHFAAEAN